MCPRLGHKWPEHKRQGMNAAGNRVRTGRGGVADVADMAALSAINGRSTTAMHEWRDERREALPELPILPIFAQWLMRAVADAADFGIGREGAR